MKHELRFRGVIQRGRLDPDRAQYVLKHLPLAMPKAGSQGRHRVFTIRQAVRLAIATHLVGGGVPVKMVGRLVLFCERIVRERTRHKAKTKTSREFSLYDAPDGEHWFVEVRDGRRASCRQQVQVKQHEDPPPHVIRVPFNTTEEFEIRKDPTGTKPSVPLIRQLLDVTDLEAAMARPE